jgi:non-heme chloroperoxidase
MQGEDDQVVPYKGAALLQVKLLKHPTLKLYPGFPHGMLTTYAETIDKHLLEFIKARVETGGHLFLPWHVC